MNSKPVSILSNIHPKSKSVYYAPAIVALIWLLALPPAVAAVKTWDGSSSGFWGTAANWAGNAIPADGDDLIFPAAAANLNNTNNIAGLDLRSITFTGSGYTLNQNAITLTTDDGINGDQPAGTSTVNLPITLATNTTFSCANAASFLVISGNVDFNGHHLTNTAANATAEIQIGTISGGVISGTGDLVKNGPGTLLLGGAVNNSYAGTTRVLAGTLELNDSSAATAMVPGDIIISAGATLLLSEGNQIADTADVTVLGTASAISTSSGLFNLNGFSETIASLTLTGGGNVSSGVGTLTLGGNVSASASGGGVSLDNPASITGNLSLGSATRTFTVSANTFISPELSISANISGAGG